MEAYLKLNSPVGTFRSRLIDLTPTRLRPMLIRDILDCKLQITIILIRVEIDLMEVSCWIRMIWTKLNTALQPDGLTSKLKLIKWFNQITWVAPWTISWCHKITSLHEQPKVASSMFYSATLIKAPDHKVSTCPMQIPPNRLSIQRGRHHQGKKVSISLIKSEMTLLRKNWK